MNHYSHIENTTISTHCWVVDGLSPTPKVVANADWPCTLARMRRGETVVFSRLDELPPEAAVDKIGFQSIGLKSHVSIPLHIDGELMGLLRSRRHSHGGQGDQGRGG